MTEHTPTPWGHVENEIVTADVREIPIAKIFLPNDPIGQSNARHIVRCVNSHDALVKALEEVTEIAARNEAGEAIGRARAALAAAKAE